MQLHVGAWAAAIDEDGALWLSDFNYNGLYKYNFETREMQLVHRFEGVGIIREALHREMHIREDEIFLFPLKDNKIRIYNKKICKEECIEIPDGSNQEYDVYVKDKKAWIFTNALSQGIWCFDFITRTLSLDEKLSSLCRDLIGKNNVAIKKGSFNTGVFLLDENRDILYSVDLDTYEYISIDVSYIKEKIIRVFSFNNKYWFLLNNSHDIYAFDYKTSSFNRYKAETQEYVENRNSIPYFNMVKLGKELILLNYYGNSIMQVSEDKFSLKKLSLHEECSLSGNINYGACYQTAIKHKESILFIPQRATSIIECNEKMNIINKYECVVNVDENEVNEMFLCLINQKISMTETKEVMTLERYLKNINKMDVHKENSFFGQNIYWEIKKLEDV